MVSLFGHIQTVVYTSRIMSEKHNHYYEIQAKTPYEMGENIGQTLRDITHHWVDRRFSDPD
jgi:hypothetical protein